MTPPLPHTRHLIGGSFHAADVAHHTSHEWQILVGAVAAACILIMILDWYQSRTRP